MGMTYTQLSVSDWDRYATGNWMSHYEKILLPWQTDYNVEYGEYYETLAQTRESDGLSVTEVLEAYMVNGGTCLLYTSPSPRDLSTSRMPSSA